MQNQAENSGKNPAGEASNRGSSVEPEFVGSIWRHPYMAYVYLTAIIFGGMILIGWMALDQGWIPSRG